MIVALALYLAFCAAYNAQLATGHEPTIPTAIEDRR